MHKGNAAFRPIARDSASWILGWQIALAFTILLVLLGPLILAIANVSWATLGPVASETFTSARLQSMYVIARRSLIAAALALALSMPVCIWLARQTVGRSIAAYSGLLALQFFVSDQIKAYAWADMYFRATLIVGAAPTPNVEFYLMMIPMVGASAPIIVVIIAGAIRGKVAPLTPFLIETAKGNNCVAALLAAPLLIPFVLAAFLLAFGVGFSASAEDQFLGGVVANNMRTLMGSLLRTGLPHAQLFSMLLIIFVTVLVAAAATIFSTRRAHPKLSDGWLAFLRRLAANQCIRTPSTRRYWISARELALTVYSWLFAVTWMMPLLYVVCLALLDCSGHDCKFNLNSLSAPFFDQRYRSALELAVGLGVAAGFISASLSVCGMWFSVSGNGWGRSLLLYVCALSLLCPGDIVSMSIQQLAIGIGARSGSPAWILPAQALLVFPYAVLLGLIAGSWHGARSILQLFEFGTSVSVITRAAWFSGCWDIIVASFLLGFALSLGDFIRPFYLGGASEGLAVVLYGRLNAGSIAGERGVFGTSAIVVAAGMSLATAASWLVAQYDRKMRRNN